jgi:ubiquinone/menaquinone biosynthesis C-methylase UbiE
MIRVLKPNGRVIITDLLSNSWLGKMEVVSADAHGPFSVNELKDFFTKYGLKDVKVSSIKYWLIGMGKK